MARNGWTKNNAPPIIKETNEKRAGEIRGNIFYNKSYVPVYYYLIQPKFDSFLII
jgi:hypothetical protein